jgi:hypothetical protein
MPGGREQPPSWAQPAADPAEQRRLLVERQVDECVEADDGVERRRRELDLGGVGVEEGRRGNEPASPPDLDGAEVHPGDRVPAGGEVTCQRHPTSAAQVEDRPAGRDPFLELRQPGAVALRFLVVAPVPVGQRVVAPANDVLGRVHGSRLPGCAGHDGTIPDRTQMRARCCPCDWSSAPRERVPPAASKRVRSSLRSPRGVFGRDPPDPEALVDAEPAVESPVVG